MPWCTFGAHFVHQKGARWASYASARPADGGSAASRSISIAGGGGSYYREHGRPVRKAVADDAKAAEQVAAQINLELTASAPTLFSFRPVSVGRAAAGVYRLPRARGPVVAGDREPVPDGHAAPRKLLCRRSAGRQRPAHEIDVEAFVRYLRTVRVAPNGHAHTRRRPLRDNGVRYILETCRSLYAYAAKRRHLPPYTENPFAGLGGKRSRVDDAKPVFVFDAPVGAGVFKGGRYLELPRSLSIGQSRRPQTDCRCSKTEASSPLRQRRTACSTAAR